jgi:hypothetical protein
MVLLTSWWTPGSGVTGGAPERRLAELAALPVVEPEALPLSLPVGSRKQRAWAAARWA